MYFQPSHFFQELPGKWSPRHPVSLAHSGKTYYFKLVPKQLDSDELFVYYLNCLTVFIIWGFFLCTAKIVWEQ